MAASSPKGAAPQVAFVLGGGGIHGAVQVGMLRALADYGIAPELIVGASVGALNGAMLAARPHDSVDELTQLWTSLDEYGPFHASLLERAATFARTRTHLHSNHRLRRLMLNHLPVREFADLVIPFACVAASIERANAHWFDEGSIVDALLATTAVPGLLPPVLINGEHFLDGGLVDSIPVGRAVEAGAQQIFVLQVGRIEQPLEPPRGPWEIGLIAFEIARRHRFNDTMANLPSDIEVHVLPSAAHGVGFNDPAQFRYRDATNVPGWIDRAYESSSEYLAEHVRKPTSGQQAGARAHDQGGQ